MAQAIKLYSLSPQLYSLSHWACILDKVVLCNQIKLFCSNTLVVLSGNWHLAKYNVYNIPILVTFIYSSKYFCYNVYHPGLVKNSIHSSFSNPVHTIKFLAYSPVVMVVTQDQEAMIGWWTLPMATTAHHCSQPPASHQPPIHPLTSHWPASHLLTTHPLATQPSKVMPKMWSNHLDVYHQI